MKLSDSLMSDRDAFLHLSFLLYKLWENCVFLSIFFVSNSHTIHISHVSKNGGPVNYSMIKQLIYRNALFFFSSSQSVSFHSDICILQFEVLNKPSAPFTRQSIEFSLSSSPCSLATSFSLSKLSNLRTRRTQIYRSEWLKRIVRRTEGYEWGTSNNRRRLKGRWVYVCVCLCMCMGDERKREKEWLTTHPLIRRQEDCTYWSGRGWWGVWRVSESMCESYSWWWVKEEKGDGVCGMWVWNSETTTN